VVGIFDGVLVGRNDGAGVGCNVGLFVVGSIVGVNDGI